MRSILKAPSPAMVVACIALAVSLSGTGYAAIKLERNSVGTRELKNNAVTSIKVRNGSLLRADFRRGQLPAGPFPEGAAKKIPAGSWFRFEVHYVPIGSPQEDLSRVGMIFADPDTVTHEVRTLAVRPDELGWF